MTHNHKPFPRLFLDLSVSTLRFLDDSFRHENVLFLRRKPYKMTPAQQERWPDGIRESMATHLILKIHDAEPNEDFLKVLTYRTFYQRTLKLTDQEVQLFIISVQTPSLNIREQYGYLNERFPGVYYSEWSALAKVPLISLNELSEKPHNAAFKCFASQKEERLKAYEILERERPELISASLKSLLLALPKVDGEYTNPNRKPFSSLEIKKAEASNNY